MLRKIIKTFVVNNRFTVYTITTFSHLFCPQGFYHFSNLLSLAYFFQICGLAYQNVFASFLPTRFLPLIQQFAIASLLFFRFTVQTTRTFSHPFCLTRFLPFQQIAIASLLFSIINKQSFTSSVDILVNNHLVDRYRFPGIFQKNIFKS